MQRLYFVFCLIYISSCAPSHFVKPLAKGQRAVNASLGGPMIKFAGAKMPIPFTSITSAYGLTESLTVYGNLHPTALVFGVFQAELGLSKKVYYNDNLNFGISVSPAVNLAFDIWQYNFKIWPRMDLNTYREFNNKKNFLYLGADNWFETSRTNGYGEPQIHHWVFNPHLGHTFVRPKWNYTLELKFLAPGILRYPNAVDYVGFGNKGAIGAYMSVTRSF